MSAEAGSTAISGTPQAYDETGKTLGSRGRSRTPSAEGRRSIRRRSRRPFELGGNMADVNIQQTPSGESRGSSGAVWAVVVIILLLVIGWFIFGGGLHRSSTTNLNVNVPGQSGGGSGGSGGGASGGGAAGGGSGGGGATKTP
jgi:hypothetical protein